LKPGLEISATAAAFPGEAFRGRISSIDPVLDPVTRSATARALLPNPDLRLRPGMLMTVDIKSAPRPALTVPELAVIGEGSGAYVWKVDAENQASRANVTAGIRRDGRVEILSGLSEGDRVVSEGTVKLRGPGPVRPSEAVAARPAAAKAPEAPAAAVVGSAA
jgi:membrane fusion protein (multidrug efflux system)